MFVTGASRFAMLSDDESEAGNQKDDEKNAPEQDIVDASKQHQADQCAGDERRQRQQHLSDHAVRQAVLNSEQRERGELA